MRVCVCVCVYVSVRVFMSASHNWLFSRICQDLWPQFFLQQSWLPLLKSQWGSSLGIRGRSRFPNPKQVTPTQASPGLKRGLKKRSPKSLDTSIFIYWRFTRTPYGSHINTLALANTGVYWSDLQGSRGQSGVMKSNLPNDRVCCWSLEIAEGFHYRVLWWRECKRGILKTP